MPVKQLFYQLVLYVCQGGVNQLVPSKYMEGQRDTSGVRRVPVIQGFIWKFFARVKNPTALRLQLRMVSLLPTLSETKRGPKLMSGCLNVRYF